MKTTTETIRNFDDLEVGDIATLQFDDGNDITGPVTDVSAWTGRVTISIGAADPQPFLVPESAFLSATREVPVPPAPTFSDRSRIRVNAGAESWGGRDFYGKETGKVQRTKARDHRFTLAVELDGPGPYGDVVLLDPRDVSLVEEAPAERSIVLITNVSDFRPGDLVEVGPIGKPTAVTVSREVRL